MSGVDFKSGGWTVTIASCIIILMLSITSCFLKGGFFEDEVVSYGLANSPYGAWIWNVDNRYSDPDMTGSVIDRDYIESYLTVSETGTFNYKQVYINQTADVHPPLFYFFFHTSCSLSPGTFSKWQGLIPNLIYFYCTLFFMYLCMTRLGITRNTAAVAMMLYAISNAGINTMLYIRMYCLLMLMTVVLTYLMIRFVQTKEFRVLPFIFLSIAMGLLTQYIYVYYAFALCLVTVIYLFKKKDYKNLLLVGSFASAGVIAMYLIYPYFFSQASSGANAGLVSGRSAVERMLDIGSYAENFTASFLYFLDEMPVVCIMAFLFAALLLICKVFNKSKNSKDTAKPDKNERSVCILIAVAFIMCFVLLVLTDPVNDSRYFYSIYPVFVMILAYVFSHLISDISVVTSHRNACLIISVIMIICLSVLLYNPLHLYRERRAYADQVSQYEHSPVIYVTGDYYKQVFNEALQFLIRSDDVLIIKNGDDVTSDQTNDYISSHKDNGHMLLYVSTVVPDIDSCVDGFAKDYSYKSCEQLFYTPRFFVYVLSDK